MRPHSDKSSPLCIMHASLRASNVYGMTVVVQEHPQACFSIFSVPIGFGLAHLQLQPHTSTLAHDFIVSCQLHWRLWRMFRAESIRWVVECLTSRGYAGEWVHCSLYNLPQIHMCFLCSVNISSHGRIRNCYCSNSCAAPDFDRMGSDVCACGSGNSNLCGKVGSGRTLRSACRASC